MANPYRTKITVKTRILYYLNGKGWVYKASIEMMAREWGVLADNVDRRCRELVNEGRIEREKIGKTVQYRIKTYTPAVSSTPVVHNERLFEIPITRRYGA